MAGGPLASIEAQSLLQYSPTDTSASGNTNYGIKLAPTLTQTATAGYTDFFINRTESSLGSGTQYFEDFQTGGTNKWIVDHSGTVTLGNWAATTIGIGVGGTGQTTASTAFNALSPMTSLGDLISGGASGAGTRLPGNTGTTKQFLAQTGTGTASTAPVWSSITAADLPVATSSSIGGVSVDGTTIVATTGKISAVATVVQPAASYYVSPTGSDSSGSGAAGSPWKTIQYAFDQVKTHALANATLNTINLADGTYTENPILDMSAGGAVVLNGNSTTPTNVVISGNVGVSLSGCLSVQYLKLNQIFSTFGGSATVGQGITFGSAPSTGNITADRHGITAVLYNYTVAAGGYRHISATNGGSIIYANGLTVTLQGTPAFSSVFLYSSAHGMVRLCDYGTAVTWSGSATGTRYVADMLSVIDTNGQSTTTYVPGNSAGSLYQNSIFR